MSEKITSEDCKRAIVGYVQAHGARISSEFYPPLTSKQLDDAMKEKNWKRRYKMWDAASNAIERSFDCVPFDDQLRGYVYERDGKIVKVFVVGE